MKKIKYLCLLLFMVALMSGCSKYSAQPLTRTDTVFDTVVTIQIYDKGSEDILDKCIDMCHEYEKLFSRTLEGSEIYKLNHAEGKAVEVSDETLKLIKMALEYCELSEGAFDITLGEISDLWNFKENEGTLPDTVALSTAVRNSGYNKIRISGNTVQLANPSVQIDLGGIAKGYIADQLKRYLKSEGIDHALINLGGNIIAIGGKPGNNSYNIGIQKPFDETGAAITSVKVIDESVVTSGNYQRYFKIDDKIYHHIIDPDNGYPYDTGLQSVTIVCDSSAQADAFSTICFAMGRKGGMRLINETDGVEALFITNDNKLYYSTGFPR